MPPTRPIRRVLSQRRFTPSARRVMLLSLLSMAFVIQPLLNLAWADRMHYQLSPVDGSRLQSLALASNNSPSAVVPEVSGVNATAQTLAQTTATARTVAPHLMDTIRQSAHEVYGDAQAEAVIQTILQKIHSARAHRPPTLHDLDVTRLSDWYKDEVVYMFYVDRFGVPRGKDEGSFADLPATLDYLKALGVTTLYLLPFMDSPMGDAGFDVKDLKAVRQDLGGLPSFETFVKAAKAQGFKIKSDLILNHLSDQHPWFQAALHGDKDKLDYFVHADKIPPYKRYRDEQRGVVVDYTEANGQISSRRLIFPDNTDTHWRKVMIGGKANYLYHTFYPFQLDINWDNPKVLYEILDVLTFWANEGVDIFRMDAIPYFMKEPGTDGENRPRTHSAIKLMSAFLQATAPATVIQVEACQWPRDILPYYGAEWSDPTPSIEETKADKLTAPHQPFTRTDEAQIAYNFPYMPALWATLLTGKPQHFWEAVAATPVIPESASWAMFLRVHDELTLEMVDLQTRALLYDTLEPRGQQFRKGLGVSGRMADFLQNDPRRIVQAFRVLLTLPGIPIIYYGDELGARNDTKFASEYAKQREAIQRKLNPDMDVVSFYDSRDINRGPIAFEQLDRAASAQDPQTHELFGWVSRTIELRKSTKALRRGSLLPVNSPTPGVFAYSRQVDGQTVLIVHNLMGKSQSVKVPLTQPILDAMAPDHPERRTWTDAFSQKPIAISWTHDEAKFELSPYQSVAIELTGS